MSSKILLFADDIKLVAKVTNNKGATLLQEDLLSLHSENINNKLPPNINKCSYFLREERANTNTYWMGDYVFKRVLEINDLGAHFDPELKFEEDV